MQRRTILYVINSETADAEIIAAAQTATECEFHLSCLLLNPAPALPMYAYGVSPYGGMNIPDNWSDLVTDAQQRQRERVDVIEGLLAKNETSADVVSVLCSTVEVKRQIARAARVCDEVFLDASLRNTPRFLQEAAYGTLFDTPVGLRVNGSLSTRPARVFVGWDSSQAAAAAVHAALPYLRQASEIMIGCIDPVAIAERDGQDPGTDLAAWLSRHGCKVTLSQIPSGGNTTSECLKDRAGEFGADLVVMGAYGHARLLEAVLGGTTRSMIDQTDLPVLLAH
ncbi:universal stress protein [Sulfitobacter sp. JB4-11]|uniref:universal stress protein n=1 Tax=Sulfitobacter rhodophyticola TaxID=3238304 RepID=UPI0035196D71